jgi:hypothetical protein
MIPEIVAAYADPLAGSYLWGWTLLGAGVFLQSGIALLVGVVLIVGALLVGGILAYAE